jgi:hypothetical protein
MVTNLENASLSLFEDASAGDFHLRSTASDAIDRGAQLEAGTCDDDMSGNPRPNGSAPDLGAFEYQN